MSDSEYAALIALLLVLLGNTTSKKPWVMSLFYGMAFGVCVIIVRMHFDK